MEMALKEGTSVYAAGGEEVGRISRFVLEPGTNEVTHVVVEKGWLLKEDKVVPMDMIKSASAEKAVLNEGVKDFNELPPFEETHYLRANQDDVRSDFPYRDAPAYYLYPPHGYIGYPAYRLGYYPYPAAPQTTTRNIPGDTVPLKEGTDVISSNGDHVGHVEKLYVQPDSNKTTHFVISQGLLFKDRKLVPAHWVKTVEEDKIYLVVSSKLLERLPSHES